MVEYKSSLKLKIPKNENIMGLSWEQYNILNCEYELNRGVDKNGEICTFLKGGIITLDLVDLPTDFLMGWIFDHMKKYNGEVTIFETVQETMEQIYFEDARCIDFKMEYKVGKIPYVITKLTLAVGKMQIGEVHFENLSK